MSSPIPFIHKSIVAREDGIFHVDGSMIDLINAFDTAKFIAQTNGHYFSTDRVKKRTWRYGWSYSDQFVRRTENILNIISAIDWLDRFSRENQAYIAPNPYLNAFCKAMESLEVDPHSFNKVINEDAGAYIQAMNRFVSRYRELVRSDDAKQLIKQLNSAVRDNAKSASEYVNYLFEHYAKLLVVRMDVSYGNDIKDRVTYQGANAHKDQLIDYARKAFLDVGGLVGFIWKLEYTPQKRYHYHLIFFFNGNKAMTDIFIAERIGRHWRDEITQGDGLFYNCNKSKHQYDQVGIGQILRRDNKKREVLTKTVVEYLVKFDLYIRAMIPKGKRTFGRGEMVQKKKKLHKAKKQARRNESY